MDSRRKAPDYLACQVRVVGKCELVPLLTEDLGYLSNNCPGRRSQLPLQH
jgi:hypothetical protein